MYMRHDTRPVELIRPLTGHLSGTNGGRLVSGWRNNYLAKKLKILSIPHWELTGSL